MSGVGRSSSSKRVVSLWILVLRFFHLRLFVVPFCCTICCTERYTPLIISLKNNNLKIFFLQPSDCLSATSFVGYRFRPLERVACGLSVGFSLLRPPQLRRSIRGGMRRQPIKTRPVRDHVLPVSQNRPTPLDASGPTPCGIIGNTVRRC